MLNNSYTFIAIMILMGAFLNTAAQGQAKRKKASVRSAPVPAVAPPNVKVPQPEPPATLEVKKNERPAAHSAGSEDVRASPTDFTPVYSYEFIHPDFTIRKVSIEHDDAGKGRITFVKRGNSEPISDPIELSAVTMDKLKKAYTALNFIDSIENYQHKKDYKHLGVMTVTMRKDGRVRTTTFNWTGNPDASALVSEYRKIGNQHIWMFDINLARENQPLQAPSVMDELDSLIRRKEISDPLQMVPFLRKLETDERVPLLARNHASKIIRSIEKDQAKSGN